MGASAVVGWLRRWAASREVPPVISYPEGIAAYVLRDVSRDIFDFARWESAAAL